MAIKKANDSVILNLSRPRAQPYLRSATLLLSRTAHRLILPRVEDAAPLYRSEVSSSSLHGAGSVDITVSCVSYFSTIFLSFYLLRTLACGEEKYAACIGASYRGTRLTNEY